MPCPSSGIATITNASAPYLGCGLRKTNWGNSFNQIEPGHMNVWHGPPSQCILVSSGILPVPKSIAAVSPNHQTHEFENPCESQVAEQLSKLKQQHLMASSERYFLLSLAHVTMP